MLRLNTNYPFFPKKPHRVCYRKLGTYYDSSSIVRHGRVGDDGKKKKKEQMFLSVSVKAMKEEELGPTQFFLRLGGLWLVTFTVLGVPIAAASFNPSREPFEVCYSCRDRTLIPGFIDCLENLPDRLLSAVIPYEESGWYDGQIWVKPPEVLARDRLLGSYKVKPVMKMLKQTLIGTGALLVSAFVLFVFATPVEDFCKTTLRSKDEVSISRTNSNKFNMRKEQLLRLPIDVVTNDGLAAAAAEAADGRPVYSRDRHYRALAGGQYCKWEDLVK
ncbi:hypothetical protein Bca101_061749 [Brassica carinata]